MKNIPSLLLCTLLLLTCIAFSVSILVLPTHAVASENPASSPAPPVVDCGSPMSDTTPTWSWSSGGGGSGIFRYRLDNGPWAEETLATLFTPEIPLAEGRHRLQVEERDQAGNWSLPGEKLFDCASGLTFFVSPTGQDSAPGTLAEPVATIGQARDLIRAIKATGPLEQPVTVFLRGGSYPLTAPVSFAVQDSGTGEAPIRYQSYGDEQPVLSGGVAIDGPWQLYTGEIMVTNVGDLRFNSLFVDGKRVVRAREPDVGESFPYHRIVRREECLFQDPQQWAEECYTTFRFQAGDLAASWQHLQEIEIVSLARWTQPRFRLDQVDEVGQVASVTRPIDGFFYGFDYDGRDRYYVENFLEGLDTPGEWYLDRSTGDLYYWPLPERPIAQSTVVAPVLGQLVRLGDLSALETMAKGYHGASSDPRFVFAASDFSISVWLYFPPGTGNPAWPLSKGDAYFHQGWAVASWSEGEDPIPSVELFVNDGNGQQVAHAGSHPRGEWGHFVWTVDRGNKMISAYKDGLLVESVGLPEEFGDITTDLPLEIGRYAGTANFMGSMDELRLFDRVLSPAEVQALFAENSVSGTPPLLELSFDGILSDSAPEPAEINWYLQASYAAGPFGQGLDFSPLGGEGISDHPAFVHHLTLAGLELAHTDWHLGSRGNIGSQVNYLLDGNPAAVAIAGTDITIDNCRIRHTGSDAVKVFGQRVAIQDSEISDIGATGVVIGSPWSTGHNYKVLSSLAQDNRIEDNRIDSFGQVFREGTAVTQFLGTGNRIAHNRMTNGPYSGISAGWWSPLPWGAFAGANLIEFNEISQVMRSLNDGAAIYVNGAQPGTIIRNNIIHDIVTSNEQPPEAEPPGTFIWGIYLDGTAAQMEVRDNLIYRTAWGGIMLNSAENGNQANLVTNNILVDGESYQLWLNGASQDQFQRNIIYQAAAAQLFSVNDASAIGVADYNLYWSAAEPDLGAEWQQWLGNGFDSHSLVADPGFADYLGDEFTVSPSSPAVSQLGFVMPDLSSVGPHGTYQSWNTTSTTTTSTTTTTTGTTTSNATTTTTTMAGGSDLTLTIDAQWNLISSAIGFQVATVFGESATFASIWTWVNNGAGGGTWAVYLPGEEIPGAYAAAKGFQEVVTVGAGEGFWLNSLISGQQVTISGTPVTGPVTVKPGWNLLGVKGTEPLAVSALGSVVSVWTWREVGGVKTWAVALPAQADQGNAYAAGKGFGQLTTIAPGEGFWVHAGE